MRKWKVLLADDHGVVRAGLRKLVDAEPDMQVVGEAVDGEAAIEDARRLHPDIAVVDVSMPKLNGLQVMQELAADCPEVRVVALTVHEDEAYLREMLDAGARGYVLKRAAAEDLIRAIRGVAAGGIYLDPSMAAKMLGRSRARRDAGRPSEMPLSERETLVMRLMAEGYSNKEIAGRLGVSVKTIETYKVRGMEKLGLHSRVELVRYAVRQGWLSMQ